MPTYDLGIDVPHGLPGEVPIRQSTRHIEWLGMIDDVVARVVGTRRDSLPDTVDLRRSFIPTMTMKLHKRIAHDLPERSAGSLQLSLDLPPWMRFNGLATTLSL